MDHEVNITDVESRPTIVVAATTTWQDFPALWGQLLDEVWTCLRAAGISQGCRNVMLYLNDAPSVEVGVLLDQPCSLTGRVVASALPSGTAAMTVHRGSFANLGITHRALLEWCAARGHQPTGVRWEIYGPHNDDPAQQWVEIYYLLN